MKRITAIILLVLVWLLPLSHVNAAPVMVSTDWLAEQMNNKNVVVVDMTMDNLQYRRFHIPGAISLPFEWLVRHRRPDKVSVRIEDKMLYTLLGRIGISRDDYIVIYDDMGGLNAGRLFWELERIGHPQMSVVDGGLVKWILENRKVDNKPVGRPPVKYQPAGKGRDNEILFEGVVDAARSGKAVLLDVRSKEEYVGDIRYPRSGHIPGARWWPWDGNVDFDKGFVLKGAAGIGKVLSGAGVNDRKQPLILYCQSGHRASQAYLTLRRMGYENVRLYDGSMAEYSRNRSAVLKRGPEPGCMKGAC